MTNVHYSRGCTRLRLVTPLPKPCPLLTELYQLVLLKNLEGDDIKRNILGCSFDGNENGCTFVKTNNNSDLTR